MDSRLTKILNGLKAVTAPCRDDMHEPDEQGLKCHVVGDHLDNACGNNVSEKAVVERYQEYVVCLERFDEDNRRFVREQINLADLIALARLAKG
jgi:hypothetical protein